MEINVGQLAEKVFGDINEIADHEEKTVVELLEDMARECKRAIQAVAKTKTETAEYAKKWRIIKRQKYGGGRTEIVLINDSGIASWLEYGTGDRKARGGQARGKIERGKYTHIRKTAEETIAKYKL